MLYLSGIPESLLAIECQIQNCYESQISIRKKPYCKMREDLVLNTNTKCTKAEFLFGEESEGIDAPKQNTEQRMKNA